MLNQIINRWAKTIMMLLCAICYSMYGLAQGQTRGTVKDASTKEVLPGVTVTVKGSNISSQTNSEGTFVVNAQEGQVLVFTFIGYSGREVTLGKGQDLEILLESSFNALEELVVVGYGSQKRSDIRGQ